MNNTLTVKVWADGKMVDKTFRLKKGSYIVQGTGIQDRRGVQIHDGDLLRDGAIVGLVAWDTPNARWGCTPGTVRPWVQCDVVGNRFQNPELIPAVAPVRFEGSGVQVRH